MSSQHRMSSSLREEDDDDDVIAPIVTNSDCDESSLEMSQQSDLNVATLRNDCSDDTSNRLPDYLPVMISIFQVCTSGFCCAECETPVGDSVDAVRRHLKKHHSDSFHGIGNVSKLHARMCSARECLLKSPAIGPATVASSQPETRLKCLVCHRSYNHRKNFYKHVRQSKGKCHFSKPVSIVFVKNECGRLVELEGFMPPAAPSDMAICKPSSFEMKPSFEMIKATISKFTRPDEDADTYVSIFTPIMQTDASFESVIIGNMQLCDDPPSESEQPLKTLLEMGKDWLFGRARHEVSLIPGNYRAALLQLDAQDIGEISQNLTYNFRHREETLLPELKKLLSFLWRSRLHNLEPFRRKVDEGDPYLVACILMHCFHEAPPSVYVHPVVVQFTLCRFFRKSHDGNLKMIGAGQNASTAATVLALLRSSVCSTICSARSNVDDIACQAVRKSQLCRTANTLSPMIRRLREMQRRKKKKRMVTVDAETGSIAVDGFEVEKEQWSSLIPSVISRCEALLSSLLGDEDWLTVADLTAPIKVGADFSISMSCQDGSFRKPTFSLKHPVDLALLDQFASYMELSFHGLGLGSCRYAEVERTDILHCVWHRSTVYFDVSTDKVYSHKSKSKVSSGKPVEHKLPPSIARFLLIFRSVVGPLDAFNAGSAVPTRTNSKHTMCHAVAEIFGFSEVPDAVQVRHIHTSILNYIYPEGDLSGALCANEVMAKSSGHAVQTHKIKYASMLLGGKEYLFRRFHAALGEQPPGVVNASLSIRPVDLKSTLQLFFGPDASYTSHYQQELVEFAASLLPVHAHADVPCGGGKSMAWMIPIAARLISGRSASSKCTIVVSPYKFLSAFQVEAATSFLSECVDAWVVALDASDFHRSSIPDELISEDFLPDLLFLTIDALAAFINNHRPHLSQLCRKGLVSRFIIDEIHTILTEDFRPVFGALSRLPSLGVPMLTMSGSLPGQFCPSVLRHIGMSTDGVSIPGMGEVRMIGGGDVLGDFPQDFSFACNVVNSPKEISARAACAAAKRNPNHGVHIMVASKSDAIFIASRLGEHSICHRLLTSEADSEQQVSIAKEWRNSQFSVLVSTSIAVVGNENPNCRHLIVNGYLFNVISMVQALNRLRPKQRSGGASVQIFLPNLRDEYFNEFWDRKEKSVFLSLSGKGLVPHDEKLWRTYGSISGLRQWLLFQEGCRIVNLSALYGTSRSNCGMCDRCKGSPVHKAAMANQTNLTHRNKAKNIAMNVIRQLEDRCLVCGYTNCNGERCLPRGSCFVCGSTDHERVQCPIDWKEILTCKGCYYCFDMYSREGYVRHEQGKACPLQRRLKRLVIHHCRASRNKTIDLYYSQVASSLDNFYAFLSQAPPRASAFLPQPPKK